MPSLSQLQTREAERIRNQRHNWILVEPGFIVEKESTPINSFALVAAKDEQKEVVEIVPLTVENIRVLLSGGRPTQEVLSMKDLRRVHPTAVTDAMCRKRTDDLNFYCAGCRKEIHSTRKNWVDHETGRQVATYRVGSDGLCRHHDCKHPNHHNFV